VNLIAHVTAQLEGFSRVLVAVSGGRDSVALLHAVARVPGLSVAVAHLDHALRASSSADAEFVRALAGSLGLEFVSERVDVASVARRRGWNLEDAARRVRYEFLTRSAKKLRCEAILTAHTLEDDAETVLIQLLRGTGSATGISARRDRILRPLLEVSKHDLEAFLHARNLEWREDESNADPSFTRNWLRLEVMPVLEARVPHAARKLALHAKLATDEDELLETWAARVPDWADWTREPTVMQRRLIRRALEAAGIAPDFEHIERMRDALSSPRVERFSLPGDSVGVVQQGKLRVFGRTVQNENLEWPTAFDFSEFPWAKLRTRAAGDRIRLPGGTRKLSDVFIDRKIPRESRDTIPVVAQNNEVLWVGLEPPILDVRVGQTRDAELEAMRVALELAREALEALEVPVGAVVIRKTQSGFVPARFEDDPNIKVRPEVSFEIVGRGRNRARSASDMTRHAELEAIRDATRHLGTPYLSDCTLVVTLEPCLMCLGAVIEARVARVVFGASNPKNGALGGVMDASRGAWNHRFDVRGGVLERASSQLLSGFFSNLRAREPL
jgi:tRNA(Ile)-lysidine synthase